MQQNQGFYPVAFFLADSSVHPRDRRDASYADDPRAYLDQVIAHWIYKIPFLIDDSVTVSEKDLRLAVAKRVTQVSLFFSFKAHWADFSFFITFHDSIFHTVIHSI